MICHDLKTIFIHIPKNAGQSIENVFLDHVGLSWKQRAPFLLMKNDNRKIGPPRLAHLKAAEYVKYKYLSQELFNQYYKFSVIRNPWCRMVSIYKYLGFNAKMSFTDFIKSRFKNKVFINNYWFVGPQNEFIYSENGELMVDFIARFENIQEDFDLIKSSAGLPSNAELPHANKSKLKQKRKNLSELSTVDQPIDNLNIKNSTGSYKDLYDQESIDIVAGLYHKDIEIFGYEF